tara:strand:+ start:1752 stop:2120 length:369 start_codon:yes stop_codon:yes gene_type:complete
MEPDFKILAIHALAPNADWTYGGTYAELNWINGNGNDKPTETAINTKAAELEAAEPMKRLREERNKRLAESDWTQSRDLTLSNDSAWATYRQALRDLPSTASPELDGLSIKNVTWPTSPSEG